MFNNLQTEAVHTLTTLQVYVTGGGQELTGRGAYRQYRKVHLRTFYIDYFGFHFKSLIQ